MMQHTLERAQSIPKRNTTLPAMHLNTRHSSAARTGAAPPPTPHRSARCLLAACRRLPHLPLTYAVPDEAMSRVLHGARSQHCKESGHLRPLIPLGWHQGTHLDATALPGIVVTEQLLL